MPGRCSSSPPAPSRAEASGTASLDSPGSSPAGPSRGRPSWRRPRTPPSRSSPRRRMGSAGCSGWGPTAPGGGGIGRATRTTTSSGARRCAGRRRAGSRRATRTSGSARSAPRSPRGKGPGSRPGSPRASPASPRPARRRPHLRGGLPPGRGRRGRPPPPGRGPAPPLRGHRPPPPAGSYLIRLDVPQLAEVLHLPPSSAGSPLQAPLEVTPRDTSERVELAASRAPLDLLARATGGRVLADHEAEQLPPLLHARTRETVRTARTPLWDGPGALLLFFAILTVEWVVRKRVGLP